jgi:hypothetical protein
MAKKQTNKSTNSPKQEQSKGRVNEFTKDRSSQIGTHKQSDAARSTGSGTGPKKKE